ncbi:hypothetical protein P691DRAFT_811226 [Macrolepiota fuliginosa MF-IS2]|uniref:Transmembrane protein n=1 Tax=Macrolepiota fuliginosa MF-IS2 TaxID=1400762 RepID=A0A9P5XFL6_9AGAR|nr:hypothetical protein P691DRAFT_811226 [Macrolepiota fuliginosa MF-IS2]
MSLSITYLVLSFVRAIFGFAASADASDYYIGLKQPLQTAKASIVFIQTMLGDGVMIWRCYVVYNNTKWILLLSVLPLAFNIVFGVLVVKTFHGDITAEGRHEMPSYLGMTLAVNTLCSCAIAYRIYRSSPDKYSVKQVFPVMGAVIRSGALYVTGITAALISFCVRSNGVYPALDAVVPLVGIVFCLIILEIHFRVSQSASRIRDPHEEITGSLPTLSTLPRWRQYFDSSTINHQQQTQIITEPRCALQRESSIFSRSHLDTDIISDSDGIKEGTRIQARDR